MVDGQSLGCCQRLLSWSLFGLVKVTLHSPYPRQHSQTHQFVLILKAFSFVKLNSITISTLHYKKKSVSLFPCLLHGPLTGGDANFLPGPKKLQSLSTI